MKRASGGGIPEAHLGWWHHAMRGRPGHQPRRVRPGAPTTPSVLGL